MKNKWQVQIIKGVLFVVLGVLAFFYPIEALLNLGLYIGYVSLFTGVLYLFYTITRKEGEHSSGWYLLEGLLDIVFGLIIITNPILTLEVIPFIVGFWVVFLGVIQISVGYALRHIVPVSNVWLLVIGVLSIVFGFLIINAPVISSTAITTLLSIFFICYGVAHIITSLKIKDAQPVKIII